MDPVLIHQIAGAGVLAFSLLLLAKQLGRLSGNWPSYLLPAALLAVGLFLVLDPIVFHGGSFGGEGQQHQIQGGLMLAVAAIEFGRTKERLRHLLWGAALPLGIVVVGVMFAIHSQHGGGDMQLQLAQHRILGATLIFTGLVQGLDSLRIARGNWAAVGWLLLLVAVSLQLFLYVEGGAPEVPMTEAGHGGH